MRAMPAIGIASALVAFAPDAARADATNTVSQIEAAEARLAEAMTMHELLEKCASADPVLLAECRGYLGGVVSAKFMLTKFMSQNCPMVDDNEELRQAFLSWAEHNPSHADRSALQSTMQAIGVEWPCTR